jgi:hypothetical protein
VLHWPWPEHLLGQEAAATLTARRSVRARRAILLVGAVVNYTNGIFESFPR